MISSREQEKFRIGPVQCLVAGLRLRSCRRLAWLLPLFCLLAGCSTTKTYTPNTAAGPAKPPDYPIPVYNGSTRIPRPTQLIGEFSIGDTSLTVSGGSLKGVMKTLMDTAHEKGADVVQITSLKKPDFDSAHYRLEANLLRYTDQWEKVALSENDFLKYLQQHQKTLDPVEGIWFDGSPDRIGVIRDNSRPGRDFIGFSLNPQLASWQPGYKRMDITRGQRPGVYNLKYYRGDFEEADASVLMARNSSLTFFIRSGDDAYAVTLLKVSAPMTAN